MSRLARCTTKGCHVRYRDGEDRPCPEHAQDPPTYAQPAARPAQRRPRIPDGGSG